MNHDNKSQENMRVTTDSQVLLEIVVPLLNNIKNALEIIENYIEDQEKLTNEFMSVKKILVGDLEKLNLGEPVTGIKGDLIKISKKIAETEDVSVEHIINDLKFTLLEELKDVIERLDSKTPWYKTMDGVYKASLTLGFIGMILLQIVERMLK